MTLNEAEVLIQSLEKFYEKSEVNIFFDHKLLQATQADVQEYKVHDFIRFCFTLAGGNGCKFLKYEYKQEDLENFIQLNPFPSFAFDKAEKSIYYFEKNEKGKLRIFKIDGHGKNLLNQGDFDINDLYKEKGHIILVNSFAAEDVFKPSEYDLERSNPKLKAISRFLRTLRHDRKDIFYLYTYAIFNGLLNLTLPLGIQAIIFLIMGARVSSSLVLLIILVIMGTLLGGALQILQLHITESLQQKIFVRSAFEFSYKVPRIKTESVKNQYVPELMNRFFDTLTLQKGIPKILIEVTSAVLQILFGLLLLSFYHPVFVFFGIFLIFLLFVIFRITGPRGLETNNIQSKYKYQTVFWLEEIARTLGTFKLAGSTNLPLQKTDKIVSNYLTYRKKHFKVLVSQYWYIIAFKTLVTAGLLILGTTLVMNEQINIGQFVAGEIIIILVLVSVEKLILSMEAIYDVLTAVEKISNVTELPLERNTGMDFAKIVDDNGIRIQVQNLHYHSSDNHKHILNDLNFSLEPGERLYVMGQSGSGKTTLIQLLSGLLENYNGQININQMPLHNLNLSSLRDFVAANFKQELLFHGTIEENITMGRDDITLQYILEICKEIKLIDAIQSLPKGFDTLLNPDDKSLSQTTIDKIILARCLAENPRLLLLEDFTTINFGGESEFIVKFLTNKTPHRTLVATGNDASIARRCDKLMILDLGQQVYFGTFEDALIRPELSKYLNNNA